MVSKYLPPEKTAAPDPALEGYYLLRGYCDDEAMRSIMDQPKDEAVALMTKIHPTRGIGPADQNGQRDQAAYYKIRDDAEQWLRDNADIAPDRAHPVYFALTKDPERVLEAMRRDPASTVIVTPASAVDATKFSVTVGDSIGNHLFTQGYREDGKTPFIDKENAFTGKVLTLKEFAQSGLSDAEAHYWSDKPLKETVSYERAEKPAAENSATISKFSKAPAVGAETAKPEKPQVKFRAPGM